LGIYVILQFFKALHGPYKSHSLPLIESVKLLLASERGSLMLECLSLFPHNSESFIHYVGYRGVSLKRVLLCLLLSLDLQLKVLVEVADEITVIVT
jgi:hypothetical protein